MNTIKKVLKREKGFTLIELLIVIAIIAVLAMLIIPRVSTSLNDANDATSKTNVKLVQSAVERYYFDKKTYPIGTTGDDTTGNGTINMSLLVSGKYIDQAPTKNGTAIVFKLTDGVVSVTP